MYAGQPYVQVPRQPDEAFGIGRNGLDDSLVKPDPYRELYEHRAETAERIDAMLFVEPHGLLRGFLPVALVALLDILHQGLKRAHRLDLPALLYGQRDKREPHQQGKGDDGYAEVQERPRIEQHQPVDHGLDDDEIPSVNYNVEKFQAAPLS